MWGPLSYKLVNKNTMNTSSFFAYHEKTIVKLELSRHQLNTIERGHPRAKGRHFPAVNGIEGWVRKSSSQKPSGDGTKWCTPFTLW